MKNNRQLRGGTDVNPDNWPDVSRLFAAAVALSASARDAYLDEACPQDPALRAAVESLLTAHDEAGSFGDDFAFSLPESVKRLAPGTQVGQFRIESLLGAGGMGEVYRAHDTKLQRNVAIKVLPDSFANDPDRRSRFAEEARALAALNHPHIGAIYGLEETADVTALVLELVEGVTLAERLAAGALAHDEIVRIARQFAEGLEAAHDRGIVHRDLKPANIKITPDGNVKILDFGLAKLEASQIRAASNGAATGPRHATHVGVIVGTAAYMSPEQARGHPVDKRTDIWAFGCVLFTMCARLPPFEGASVSDTLTAVMECDPEWSLLPGSTPRYVVRLLRRCLTKDPKLRLRDIGEARIALELGDDADASYAPVRSPTPLAATVAIASALALAALFVLALYRPAPSTPMPVRFNVFPPAGGLFNFHPGQTFFTLSPDGSRLAFLASTESLPLLVTGESSIWVREMADVEARPLAGTDGATSAFWSPDSRSLAFVADRTLKRIDLPDGPAVTIRELPFLARQGTWGADGVILVSDSAGRGIFAVPAGGGTHREILTPNRSSGEARVLWPWFLPDGKRFLYTVRRDNGEGELRVGELDGGQLRGTPRTVMPVSSNTQWVDPDIVVFAREGVLMGQRVDLEGPRPIGEPFSIAEPVEYFFTTARATFAASPTGTVAYHQGGDLEQLVWVDRNGNESGTISPPAAHDQSTRLSRDGRMLLTARRRPGPGTYDIWRHDLVRQTDQRLTHGPASELAPVWTDDERAIIFAGDSPGSLPHLHKKDLVTGEEKPLVPPGLQQLVLDLLPGGRAVAYAERQAVGAFRTFQLPLTAGATPAPLLPPQFTSFQMRVSPDGRAMGFISSRGGRLDLYVAPLPVTSEPELAATGVWSAPRWSADGRYLYYLADRTMMMSIPIRTAPSLVVGMPQNLFELKQSASLLEVSREGRFLLLVPKVRAAERPIIVATAAISSAQR